MNKRVRIMILVKTANVSKCNCGTCEDLLEMPALKVAGCGIFKDECKYFSKEDEDAKLFSVYDDTFTPSKGLANVYVWGSALVGAVITGAAAGFAIRRSRRMGALEPLQVE